MDEVYCTSEITDVIRAKISNRLKFDRCEDCGNRLYELFHMTIRWRAKHKSALCDGCVE